MPTTIKNYVCWFAASHIRSFLITSYFEWKISKIWLILLMFLPNPEIRYYVYEILLNISERSSYLMHLSKYNFQFGINFLFFRTHASKTMVILVHVILIATWQRIKWQRLLVKRSVCQPTIPVQFRQKLIALMAKMLKTQIPSSCVDVEIDQTRLICPEQLVLQIR